MLRDSNKHWLMVCCSVNCGHTIGPRRKPSGYCNAQDAISRRSVHTLEKCEFSGVRRIRVFESVNALDDDMRMAGNVSAVVNLLGCREIIGVCIDKVACVKMLDRKVDGERRVGLDSIEILWRLELCGWNVVHRRDNAHWSSVARATLHLLAICKWQVWYCCTEVDEVV